MTDNRVPLLASDSEPLWTIHDVAEYLAVAPDSVYALVSSGRIPALRLRHRLRFDPTAVRAAIRSEK